MKVDVFLETDKDKFILALKESSKNNPDLMVLFLPSYVYSNKDLFKLLKEITKDTICISLSTIGVIKDDVVGYDQFGGFSIKFEKEGSVETFLVPEFSKINISILKDKISEFLEEDKNTTYLMFSTAKNVYINKLLDDIFKNGNKNVRLYGAVASSNLKGFPTYMSSNGEILEEALVIIKLKNVISYSVLSFGFIPVGATYKITKAKENRIYEIDDMSIDYFLYNLLKNTNIDIKDIDQHMTSEILWEFPLLLIDQDKKYISSIRTFKEFIPEEKAVAFYGLIEENALIKLSTGDSEDILKDAKNRAIEFFNNIKTENKHPDVILNVNCAARNYVLSSEGKGSAEQQTYKEVLKDFNIAGLLTFGEIGPDRFGKPGEFFNETSILVGLEEV